MAGSRIRPGKEGCGLTRRLRAQAVSRAPHQQAAASADDHVQLPEAIESERSSAGGGVLGEVNCADMGKGVTGQDAAGGLEHLHAGEGLAADVHLLAPANLVKGGSWTADGCVSAHVHSGQIQGVGGDTVRKG